MAVMKFTTTNRFTPLKSITSSESNPKNDLIPSQLPSSSKHKSKGTNFAGPGSADARKTASLRELHGVPVLDMSGATEEVNGSGWMLHKNGKDVPVLETIDEEEDVTGLLQFTSADIKKEVDFWNNAVFCYILGANPPWDLVKSFIYRVWDQFGIDRVSFLDNGSFLVRFATVGARDALLKSGYYLFDNKPVVIKPWVMDMELVKAKVETVPVWVRLSGVPLKFWGDCLPSIAGLVGKFVQKDKDTQDKVRLSFARVLVELQMDQELPDKVKFLDETGKVVSVGVDYEWIPRSCTSCNGIGHSATQCRKPGRPSAKKVRNLRPVCLLGYGWGTSMLFSPIERLGGCTTEAEMEHFQECVSLCGMEDINATGALYTWSNKQEPTARVYSRLDRAMGNQEWLDEFGDYMAHFHPGGLFDHCPCTVVNRKAEFDGRRSFKYFNMWGAADSFKAQVASVWQQKYKGTRMFSVVKKLKALKPVLKKLNTTCFSDIENSTTIASRVLEEIQEKLVDNPGDTDLIQQELDLSVELKGLINARDSFLTQKAKLQWSLEGDLNTSYFHRAIKKKIMLNKVFQIEDMQGVLCTEGATIQTPFLAYYQKLLGTQNSTDPVNVAVVRRGPCCSEDHWSILAKPVTCSEVKACFFSIPSCKSPGPDGYNSKFYKDAWDVIGDEVCAAIINFFDSGQLLSQVNATVITLIPKNDRPTSVVHYRPISCCNVLYKVISKILCARLALVLPDIISKNQVAFVKGRSILENILICQDLVRMYNRRAASPRCMFKLDLQKAYDSIEWGFLEQMLAALNFPEQFRHLIMQCVTTPSYTLNLNGTQFGFFAGRRGLRQGDPISTLLFCVSMEYLSSVMNYAVGEWYFKFHPHWDHQSIMLILRVLATFTAASGLRVNASKSEVVFNGVTEALRQDITFISGFQEGVLPFKYLGVPIQGGRLTRHDCNILVERIVAKIRGIGARKLSYAGRIILINSVFNTLHNYWCSIFLLPKCIIKKIEALCRNFLWNGDAVYQRTPLVAWGRVYIAVKRGGLGVKNLWGMEYCSFVGKLVNWIYTKADRLWVLWVDHIYMKGADWYTYSPPPDSNWNWRNICKVKNMLAAGYQGNQWISDARGYSIYAGYQWLQGSHPHVPWYKDVWDSWTIPKHCVIETHDHLFSDCIYSKQVISLIEHWLHIRFQTPPGHCSTVRRKVWRVVKLSCWYVLWMERNTCRIELKLRRPAVLVSEIQKTV
ncbi:uncharacterized protein LOC141656489 [Silene latifolia]|uniref:uncharacterized protein LOC141656489 n=1 Tax=Silene latifolia TaxID=37657 RepID=UPI003D76D86A